MKKANFFKIIKQGIPNQLPRRKRYDKTINHAPSKQHNLSIKEKKIALKNALRYFPKKMHKILIQESETLNKNLKGFLSFLAGCYI